MAQMTAVQIPRPGSPFEVVKRDIPVPGTNQVRIKVHACGICHSDVVVKEGIWPGLTFPRVTGHEVAGVIDEVGHGVTAWKKGQRVGVAGMADIVFNATLADEAISWVPKLPSDRRQ